MNEVTPSFRPRHGFTLVELLVVIAIIALLMALLLPAVQAARESGRRTRCANTVKQLALACLTYESSAGMLPPGTYRSAVKDGGPNTRSPTWIAHILPFVDQQPLYDRIDWKEKPGDTGANVPLKDTPLPLVRCPSDGTAIAKEGWQPTNYVASVGETDQILPVDVPHPGAFFIGWDPSVAPPSQPVAAGGRRIAQIRDGMSSTLLLSECVVNWPFIKRYEDAKAGYGRCQNGLEPPLTANDTSSGGRGKTWFMGFCSQDWTFSTLFPPNDPLTQIRECEKQTAQGYFAARSRHPGVVNTALADGSVRGVTDAVDVVVWRKLGTVAEGMPVDASWW